jgi:peptide/nickel transport system ATP-binding protein
VDELLLRVQEVSKTFELRGVLPGHRRLRALDKINLEVQAGQTLGIVGESGSGKSTLCRIVLRLTRPSGGRVIFSGRDIATLSRREMRRLRRGMQAVFQDTASAFNPRHTVRDALLVPLEVHNLGTRRSRPALVEGALQHVGLDASFLDRHPHMLSGGQRQRVAIARAIILRPSLVVADEPTSALDVSVQARILNLFKEIQRDLGLAYLFVSHNLGVIRYVSDAVAVMYLGRIVEAGPVEQVFSAPQHPYTRALLEAIPPADPTKRRRDVPIIGELPSAYRRPPGCAFHPRCPVAMEICSEEDPMLYPVGEQHRAACLWHDPRFAAGAPPWIGAKSSPRLDHTLVPRD